MGLFISKVALATPGHTSFYNWKNGASFNMKNSLLATYINCIFCKNSLLYTCTVLFIGWTSYWKILSLYKMACAFSSALKKLWKNLTFTMNVPLQSYIKNRESAFNGIAWTKTTCYFKSLCKHSFEILRRLKINKLVLKYLIF